MAGWRGRAPALPLLLTDKPVITQIHDHALGHYGWFGFDRLQVDLRRFRRFVRGADAGEIGDLAGVRLDVESLRIPPPAFLNRGVDVDLDELARRQARANACDPASSSRCS